MKLNTLFLTLLLGLTNTYGNEFMGGIKFPEQFTLEEPKSKVKEFEIMGQLLQVEDFSFFSFLSDEGKQILHTGKFVDATSFEFADNNTIDLEAGAHFWLHRDGSISNLMNIGLFDLNLNNGEKLLLDCKKHVTPYGEQGRIISFHANGRYHRGCQSMVQKWLENDHYKLNIRYQSIVELDQNGFITYATKLSNDSVIKLKEDLEVNIRQDSAVAFHKNGMPRFFTIKIGDEVKFETKNIGTVTLHTDPFKPQAVTLNENGDLIIAAIKDKVSLNFKGQTYEFSSLAAQFYPTGELFSLFVDGNTQVNNPELDSLIVLLKGGSKVVCVDKSLEVRDVSFCAGQI